MAHMEDAGRRSTSRVDAQLNLDDFRKQARSRLGLLLFILILILWEWRSRAGVLSTLFFPAPTVIAHQFWELVVDGTIPTNILLSLKSQPDET